LCPQQAEEHREPSPQGSQSHQIATIAARFLSAADPPKQSPHETPDIQDGQNNEQAPEAGERYVGGHSCVDAVPGAEPFVLDALKVAVLFQCDDGQREIVRQG
jgi:hypothetical protein